MTSMTPTSTRRKTPARRANAQPSMPVTLPSVHMTDAPASADAMSGDRSFDGHNSAAEATTSMPSDSPSGVMAMFAAPQANLPALYDPTLALLADSLDDIERARIAAENRLRRLTRAGEDKDGELRGLGLPDDAPVVVVMRATVLAFAIQEKAATSALVRQLREHPLYPVIKAAHGVGDKQAARLLAAIRDPYWNDLHDRPRTLAELWAFCGYVPGQRRQRGKQSNWSSIAKSRAYLIAESCVRSGKAADSPYYRLYAARKAHTEGRLHDTECMRCGPSGKPAQPGTPLSDAHRHADALRIVAKTVLRDLYVASRRFYE